MTAQISDRISLKGSSFIISDIDGRGLFEPQAYGIKVIPISTACLQGYLCTYAVESGLLLLTQVSLGLDAESVNEVNLFGKTPERSLEHHCFVVDGKTVKEVRESHFFEVSELVVPIRFTGGLLVARNFVKGMSVTIGHAPAYKFQEVYQLNFDRGVLVSERDVSNEMATLRNRLIAAQYADAAQEEAEISAWIELSFGLEFKTLVPFLAEFVKFNWYIVWHDVTADGAAKSYLKLKRILKPYEAVRWAEFERQYVMKEATWRLGEFREADMNRLKAECIQQGLAIRSTLID